MQRRASANLIAFAPDGKRQADAATVIPNGSITALFPDTAKSFYNMEQTREDVADCSGEEIIAKLLTGQIGNLTLAFDATTSLLGVIIAYAKGVAAAPTGSNPYVHQINDLPIGSYQPPYFTLIYGFQGQTSAVKLRGCVINSWKVTGKARSKVTVEVNIKFIEAVSVSGYTFPACANTLPLRFADCQLTTGATNLTTAGLLRSFEYSEEIGILTGDHAFTGDAALASRLERADKRVRRLAYSILGDNKDAVYLQLETGLEQLLSLQIGTSASDRIVIAAPQAYCELDGGGLKKDGQANETIISIIATPEAVAGNSNSPVNAVITNAQSTAFLLT